MLLYHGTLGKCVDSIRRRGLLPPPEEQWRETLWSYELGLPPSTFMATQPRASNDSDPLGYAKLTKEWFCKEPPGASKGDGYIVVIRCPWDYLSERLRGIWATWDVLFYFRALGEASDVLPYRYKDQNDPALRGMSFYDIVELRRPDVARVLRSDSGNDLRRDPDWLRSRRLERPTEDCQVVAGPIEPEYILDIVRVYDSGSCRIVPEFDPKRQGKLKHKKKSFASLFRKHVLEIAHR